MLKTVEQNNLYIVFDDSLIDENIERCFDPQYWQSANKVVGSASGRGTTWFVQLETMQGALRHYRRGGLFGKLIADHYLFLGWQKTRSVAEFRLLQKLIKSDVNVPKPIAARVIKKGLFYQADLLSEKIPDAMDLVELLKKRRLTKQELVDIGKEVKKLHQAQVNHTDLNIHNILIDASSKVWIIDFDKCYQQLDNTWKKGNLNRLLRSFRKEVKKRSIQWGEDEWLLLLDGYNTDKL